MHRSALGAISIDLPAEQAANGAAFWGSALGRTVRSGTEHPEFQVLEGGFNGLVGLVQSVGDTEPRVHLDVHTDDLEAEVRRLCALGASELARHGGWVVLADPAGLVFCVVPVRSDDPLLEGAAVYE